jgi:hypothetical protein
MYVNTGMDFNLLLSLTKKILSMAFVENYPVTKIVWHTGKT